MKKEILCQVGDSLYEAFVVDNGGSDRGVVLNCSPLDKGWTTKALAKSPVVIHNNGNGINVKFDDGKELFLDYSQVVELRTVLNIEDSLDKKPTKLRKWTKA
jgi:hypothetical protein